MKTPSVPVWLLALAIAAASCAPSLIALSLGNFSAVWLLFSAGIFGFLGVAAWTACSEPDDRGIF